MISRRAIPAGSSDLRFPLTAWGNFYLEWGVQPVNIEIPLGVFDGFVGKCDEASREYAILKNGLLVRRGKDRLVKIECRMEDADKLLVVASDVYPDAAEHIKRGIVIWLKSAYP
jgi:hypothetical protein